MACLKLCKLSRLVLLTWEITGLEHRIFSLFDSTHGVHYGLYSFQCGHIIRMTEHNGQIWVQQIITA